MKKSMWTICLMSLLGLALFPACMTSTTVAEDDDSRSTLNTNNVTDENNDDDSDNNNNNNNNNDDAAAAAAELLRETAEAVCQEMIDCTNTICTTPIIELASCTNDLVANYSQAELQSQMGLGCDVINASMCTQEAVRQQCTCPEAAQGTCPDGQFCSVMLTGASGTSYACGDANGGVPSDAAVCDNSTPCADPDNEICVATSQGATSGICLLSCTQ